MSHNDLKSRVHATKNLLSKFVNLIIVHNVSLFELAIKETDQKADCIWLNKRIPPNKRPPSFYDCQLQRIKRKVKFL